jgi:Zn-finger nucleic acid-binding protein
MREVLIGGTALMECDACHGIWIDTATFEHICADQATQTAVLAQWSPTPRPSAGEIHYRPCIACGKMMNRMNFGRVSGTVIDVCKGHGVFLDAGELHQVVVFLQSGGLDRARQQQIEDLKEEEERLRSLQRQQEIFADHGLHSSSEIALSSTWTEVGLLGLLNKIKK